MSYCRRIAGVVTLVLLSGCAVPPPRGAQGPNVEAIETANAITFSADRLTLLRKVAKRHDLTQVEQTYLVDSICFSGFGGPQADALVTLIDNPICTPKTRTQIADRLRAVTLGIDRRRVAEALTAASAREAGIDEGGTGSP